MNSIDRKTGARRRGRIGMAATLIALTAMTLPAAGHKAPTSRAKRQDEPHPVQSKPHPIPDNKNIVVLFSGKPEEATANWVQRDTDTPAKWKVEDGDLISGGGDITTKEKFNDYQLHVEFWEPYLPNNHGQERGNSGVALDNLYEIQVLDSFGIAVPGKGDCGAVYDQSAPLVNACRPPLQWQTYDIIFRAPRWDADGKKTENARVSVIQNGIVVQNNTEIPHETGIAYGRKEHPGPGAILLQDHGFKVKFRNVWVLPLPEKGSPNY
jgi:hypothetical protein